ncbi:MAG: hemolysin III family protein [Acidimicrobiia bacterium]
MDVERLTLGRMQNPVRGFLHGGAAVVSAVGLGLLVARVWGDGSRMVAAIVFGVSLVAMYTVSALFHSIDWRPTVWRWMQRVDHSMIFLLVAGTTTPLAIAGLSGWPLVGALGVVWGIALVGITLKLTLRSPLTWLSVTLQLIMGWSAVVWFPALLERFSWAEAWPIIAGGLAYTIGVVFYATQRPRLFPRVFSAHELFHVLVVTASSLHFAAVWRLLPA